MDLATKTFTVEGITFTVRERIGGDFFDGVAIRRALPPDPQNIQKVRREHFCNCFLQTTKVEGNLGLAWPPVLAIPELYEKWSRLGERVVVGWAAEISRWNDEPKGDPALAPVAEGESSPLP